MSGRRFWLLIVGLVVAAGRPGAASDRADIVVYADHKPALARDGTAFLNPFTSREDNDPPGDPVTDPGTRILLEPVLGLRNPLGTMGWGLAAWGKYVLTGNFDEAAGGFPQNIEDQRIGLFDSEAKQFCQIDLDPGAVTNAGVEWVVVADPKARQSRIYWEGFGAAPSPGISGIFGYLEGNLDNGQPCNPQTGWAVHRFTPADLNAAAAGLPVDRQPCPGNFCGFDGIALLRHDAATGSDTVVFHNWWGTRLVVATVDGAGVLHVPDVYLMPVWRPAAANGACMNLRPVIVPAVDPTRPANDRRFASGFDMTCDTPAQPNNPPGCAPHLSLCPGTGLACNPGDTCPKYVCSQGYADCDPGQPSYPQCPLFSACTNACLLVHPGTMCTVTANKHCAREDDCPYGCPGGFCFYSACYGGSRAGQSCEYCACGTGRPVQEFRFDGSTISATSAQFQAAETRNMGIPGAYDTDGGLWAIEGGFDLTGATRIDRYGRNFYGEHSYYNPSNPGGAENWPPDLTFGFETSDGIFGTPQHAIQVGAVMYFSGRASIQRELSGYGTWIQDTAYKTALGSGYLPSEARRCSAGSNAGMACLTAADCPGGACIIQESAIGEIWKADMSLGGSPPSIWTTPRLGDNFQKHGNIDAYLLRLPVATYLPDNLSAVRPGATWTSNASCGSTSCDRLWLVAEHDGTLKFRVRDDGLWSTWYPLPTNVALAGGASAITYAGTVELYARATSGTVMTTSLTSPIDCAPASCTWAAWQAVPGSPVTDQEPAATVQGTVGPFIAVRRASDGRMTFARRHTGVWSTWRLAGTGVLTDVAPALVWNPEDTAQGRIWLVARQQGSGVMKYLRIDGLDPGSWKAVAATGAVEPWGTAPGVVYDGTRVRLFAGRTGFPSWTYQVTSDNDVWDKWTPIFSEGMSTMQPVPALVNGDVNLITYWYTAGIQEQLVK